MTYCKRGRERESEGGIGEEREWVKGENGDGETGRERLKGEEGDGDRGERG